MVTTLLVAVMRAPASEKPPANVELDVSFVCFELKDIEAMARETRGAAPTQKQIQKAWTEGKGRLVAISKIITLSGQQAKTEGVLEKIFPTAYEPPRCGPPPAQPTYRGVNRPTPGGFQTWNAGCTISLTAQIDEARNRINLTLTPELSKFLGWDSIEMGQTEYNKKVTDGYQQPEFQLQRVTTHLVVPMSQTIVTGGLPDSTTKKPVYIFITARRAGSPR